jgi:hypothetical protein
MSKYAKELPTTSEDRKAVVAEIDKIVDAMLEMQSLKDVIKDAKTYCQDKFEVDGGYVAALAQLKFDKLYEEGKKAEKIAEQAEMLEIVESL